METRAEYRKRLLMIEHKVRHVPPNRFFFGHWVGRDWQGMPDLSCGTTGCAIGWGTTIPYLRELGLHLHRGDYNSGTYPTVGETPAIDSSQSIAELLGLNTNQYDYLFYPSVFHLTTNATNIQVADHIRHWVDWYYPEFAKHPAWPTLSKLS